MRPVIELVAYACALVASRCGPQVTRTLDACTDGNATWDRVPAVLDLAAHKVVAKHAGFDLGPHGGARHPEPDILCWAAGGNGTASFTVPSSAERARSASFDDMLERWAEGRTETQEQPGADATTNAMQVNTTGWGESSDFMQGLMANLTGPERETVSSAIFIVANRGVDTIAFLLDLFIETIERLPLVGILVALIANVALLLFFRTHLGARLRRHHVPFNPVPVAVALEIAMVYLHAYLNNYSIGETMFQLGIFLMLAIYTILCTKVVATLGTGFLSIAHTGYTYLASTADDGNGDGVVSGSGTDVHASASGLTHRLVV